MSDFYYPFPWIFSNYLTKPVELKFIHSEKATKFYEISTVDLSCIVPVKSTVEILQNFVAFSEYMNFKLPGMKWLDCGLKMVSNFGQFGSRIGHNVIQQRNNHVIQNFLVDTSIDFDPWPDFQIHHFNLAPVYFLSCFNKFLGLDLYLQMNQNCVREKNQWGKNVTRLK